eukprot:COSAG02_NODE_33176_length_504_cov_0.864198_1_plen_22_part_10
MRALQARPLGTNPVRHVTAVGG